MGSLNFQLADPKPAVSGKTSKIQRPTSSASRPCTQSTCWSGVTGGGGGGRFYFMTSCGTSVLFVILRDADCFYENKKREVQMLR